jgi:hypothetical protein
MFCQAFCVCACLNYCCFIEEACGKFWIFFWWDWGLNSGLQAYKADTSWLEPHFLFILLWLFWKTDLVNYFPGPPLSVYLPDFIFPSS